MIFYFIYSFQHHLLVVDKNYPHIVYVDKGDKISTHTEMPIEAPKDELEGNKMGRPIFDPFVSNLLSTSCMHSFLYTLKLSMFGD